MWLNAIFSWVFFHFAFFGVFSTSHCVGLVLISVMLNILLSMNISQHNIFTLCGGEIFILLTIRALHWNLTLHHTCSTCCVGECSASLENHSGAVLRVLHQWNPPVVRHVLMRAGLYVPGLANARDCVCVSSVCRGASGMWKLWGRWLGPCRPATSPSRSRKTCFSNLHLAGVQEAMWCRWTVWCWCLLSGWTAPTSRWTTCWFWRSCCPSAPPWRSFISGVNIPTA